MNIPINFLFWIVALIPIVTLLVLMAGYQWPASKAAPLGLLIAAISGLVLYQADFTLIGLESLKGLWATLGVLIVVWPAILLFEVVYEAKAFVVFRQGLAKLTPNELIRVFAIGWIFVSFLQGITGFGVPVAVGAPLLVGIGLNPLWAVLIALIGHSWANTFGTLAVAWNALVTQTGIDATPELLLNTALWAGIFIWVWNLMLGFAIAYIYGGFKAIKKGLPAILIISLIQGGGQLLFTQFNQTLAAFVPSTLALLTLFVLNKTPWYNKPWKISNSRVMSQVTETKAEEIVPKGMSLWQAFLPYFILTVITLTILLITPLKNFLGQWRLGLAFPETITGYGYVNPAISLFSPIAPFTHAGTFLLLASIFGYLYFKKFGWIEKEGGRNLLKRSFKKTLPSTVAVAGFIIMSRLMGGTGQTLVLAQGFASALGNSYTFIAPVIGMLGAFMTSSNMASNILFGEFQMTSATLLNLDVASVLGAQTAGGAVGNTICPGNIILGTTTAGNLGQEGLILKKVLPLALTAALFIGLILFVYHLAI
jgi:lactate permease